MVSQAVTPRASWFSKYVPLAGSGCILYYPMQDDQQKDECKDISGYGNNGDIITAVWTRLENGLWVLVCDGTNDYVLAGADTIFDNIGESAWEMWVKLTDPVNSYNALFGRKGDDFKLGVLGSNWGNTIFCSIGTGASDDIDTGISYTSYWSKWAHLVFFISEATNTFRAFLNGVNVYSTTSWTGEVESMVGSQMVIFSGVTYNLKGVGTLPRIYNVLPPVTMPAIHYRQERHLFRV